MESRDVLIKAPPITPDGSVLMTDAEVKAFQKDYEQIRDIASNMATVLIAFLLNEGEGEQGHYKISKDFLQKAKGAQIQLREDADGNVIATVLSRSPQLISLDGRL